MIIPVLLFLFIFFWPCHAACGIKPRPGFDPLPPAVEGQSPDRWATGEVLPASTSDASILCLPRPPPPPLGRRPAFRCPGSWGAHLWGRRLRWAQSESCPPRAQAALEGKRPPLCRALVSLPSTAGPQCYPLGDAKRIRAESCPQGGSGNQRK